MRGQCSQEVRSGRLGRDKALTESEVRWGRAIPGSIAKGGVLPDTYRK